VTRMPKLETARIISRTFAMDDLQAIHQIFDVELREADFGTEGAQSLHDRIEWLQWTILSYEQLAKLNQPPYGERAVTLKQIGQLIGACGFVPCLNVFNQLPSFSTIVPFSDHRFASTEFGLYYAISPICQRQGYATEAARAMVDYAFQYLNLQRIVATTTYENAASVGVMRKLGMRVEKNFYPDPPWLQVVGFLENQGNNAARV
jgi:RimJ/RimL family protein N-acetyltransferase